MKTDPVAADLKKELRGLKRKLSKLEKFRDELIQLLQRNMDLGTKQIKELTWWMQQLEKEKEFSYVLTIFFALVGLAIRHRGAKEAGVLIAGFYMHSKNHLSKERQAALEAKEKDLEELFSASFAEREPRSSEQLSAELEALARLYDLDFEP